MKRRNKAIKKNFSVIFVIALVFSSAGLAFANETSVVEIPLNDNIEFEIPLDKLSEEAPITVYIVENEDGTLNIVDNENDTIHPQGASVLISALKIQWDGLYVTFVIQCQVVIGDSIVRCWGKAEMISDSLLNPVVYSNFNFDLGDRYSHFPARSLSQEYSAWVGYVDKVKIRLTNVKVETMYGEVGSVNPFSSVVIKR